MATFAVILSMLILDTALCVLDVNSVIQEISDTLTSDSTASLQERYKNKYSSWAVGNAPFAFMVRCEHKPILSCTSVMSN